MPSFDPVEMAMWTGGTWDPLPPKAIDGVSNDTRSLNRGNVYFALTGGNFEGHAFVERAFEKGASGAVVSDSWMAPESVKGRPLLRVAAPARALRDVAAGYRQKLNPRIVAVTGSAGKTTVKEMTAHMLSTTLPVASTKGNWNNDIGLPLSLLAMSRQTRVGVFEVGTNHPGELAPLCGLLKPTWGVVTNVGPVHIEFFGSVESIAREKAEVLRCLPPDGVAVLNQDDPSFNLLCDMAPGRVITISMRDEADYACLARDPGTGSATIRERSSGEEHALQLSLTGEHNIVNVLLAIAVARGFGVSWEDIRRAASSYCSLPMRWETKQFRGITAVNDAYNANPLSMRAALRTFAEMPAGGRKWLLLGGMLELGSRQEEEHLAVGRHVGAGDWAGLIAVGPLGKLIARGAEEAGFSAQRIFCCANNEAAAHVAVEQLKSGDRVLLKASRGMRLEEVLAAIEKRGGTRHDCETGTRGGKSGDSDCVA